MKKILLIFILQFLILLLNADNNFQSNYKFYNNAYDTLFEFDYNYLLPNSVIFNFKRYEEISKNINYDRESKWNNNIWNLYFVNKFFKNLSLGYETNYDNGIISKNKYKIIKTKKYIESEINIISLDKISFTNNVRFLQNKKKEHEYSSVSDGLQIISNVLFKLKNNFFNLNSKFILDKKNLDYENHQFIRNNTFFNFNFKNLSYESNIFLEDSEEDIFIFKVKKDTYKKKIINHNLSLNFSKIVNFSFKNNFQYKKNKFNENIVKNYENISNKTISYVEFFYNWVKGKIGGSFNYDDKNYSKSIQSLAKLDKSFFYEIKYEYSNNDTIGFIYDTNLEQFFYNEKENIYDQDILQESNKLFINHNFEKNMNLYLIFSYSKRDEMFLHQYLSSANRRKENFIIQPKFDIMWDNALLRQVYSIQAIYDTFLNQNDDNNKLFRKFSATYLFEFPLYKDNLFSFDLITIYKYENWDNGNYKDDIFYRLKNNKLHTIESEIKLYDKVLSLRLKSRFYIDNIVEYSPIFEIKYKNKNKIAKLLVNPTGKSIDSLIWKIDGQIGITF